MLPDGIARPDWGECGKTPLVLWRFYEKVWAGLLKQHTASPSFNKFAFKR